MTSSSELSVNRADSRLAPSQMRYFVTKQRRLSLAGRKPRISPVFMTETSQGSCHRRVAHGFTGDDARRLLTGLNPVGMRRINRENYPHKHQSPILSISMITGPVILYYWYNSMGNPFQFVQMHSTARRLYTYLAIFHPSRCLCCRIIN